MKGALQGYAPAGDTQLFYEITEGTGAGAPLLLLHGNGEDHTLFDGMVPILAADRRVIAMDSRGHGKSGRGKKSLDFDTLAEDVGCLLDHLALERVCLLGFSDGGNTALAFGLRSPRRLERLVLVGANRSPAGIKAHCQWPIVLGYGLCSLFVPFSAKARLNWEILGLMVRHPHFRSEELGAIPCPALIAAGEKDMVKEAETRAIAEALPHSRLETLPGAGHFLPGECPEELARLAAGFFRGEPAGG